MGQAFHGMHAAMAGGCQPVGCQHMHSHPAVSKLRYCQAASKIWAVSSSCMVRIQARCGRMCKVQLNGLLHALEL